MIPIGIYRVTHVLGKVARCATGILHLFPHTIQQCCAATPRFEGNGVNGAGNSGTVFFSGGCLRLAVMSPVFDQTTFPGDSCRPVCWALDSDSHLGSLHIFALRYGNTSEVVTFILHMCDYVEYKLTGRNIGQLLSAKLIG